MYDDTAFAAVHESAVGISRTSALVLQMSAVETPLDAVVDDVAANDQSDRWHAQACGVGRIGSPRIYCDELVPLQLQSVSFQRLGNQKAGRNLSRKKRRQKLSTEAGESWSCIDS